MTSDYEGFSQKEMTVMALEKIDKLVDNVTQIRADFSSHLTDSASSNARLDSAEKTLEWHGKNLFGEKGDNGLSGDMKETKTNLSNLKFALVILTSLIVGALGLVATLSQ